MGISLWETWRRTFWGRRTLKPDLCLRFIGDILLLWTHCHYSLLLILFNLLGAYPLFLSSSLMLITCWHLYPHQTHQPPAILPLFQQPYFIPKCSIPFSQSICSRDICNHLSELSNFTSNLISPQPLHPMVTLSLFSNARFTAAIHLPNLQPTPYAP